MYNNLHAYIHLDWDGYANDENSYLKNLYKIVEVSYIHHTQVFYSKKNVREFVDACNDLDTNFTQSVGNQLGELLLNATAISDDHILYKIKIDHTVVTVEEAEGYYISGVSINQKISMISLSLEMGYQTFLYVKSVNNFGKQDMLVVNSKYDLASWIFQNGPARNFNLSPKHGKDGISSWYKGSKLLCSEEEAQALLNKSIADFNRFSNRLFCYDDNHNTFIEFFYEGNNPQLKWHGFHLDLALWKTRVPSSIRDYFGK